MNILYTLIMMMSVTLFGASASAQGETPLDFVKGYVQTVNADFPPEEFSKMWRKKAQTHLHDTPEALQKEYQASVNMHRLFLEHGNFELPQINEWGDAAKTTSLTYSLHTPIDPQVMQANFGYGSGNIWGQYQITVEKENNRWVVSGESFIGTP